MGAPVTPLVARSCASRGAVRTTAVFQQGPGHLGREQQDLVCVQNKSPPNIEERGRTSHLGLVCVSGACQLWVVAEHPVDNMSPPEAAVAGRETLPKHTKCICGICWVRGYVFL